MKIQFRDTYTVKAVGGVTYLKGHSYDLPPDSAAHFINRGLAAPHTETPVVNTPESESQPSPVVQQVEVREITTNVDLHGAFAKARAKEGIKESKTKPKP